MKFFHLFLSLLFVGQIVAQEPAYKWGAPQTNADIKRGTEQLMPLGDKGFVLLRQSRSITQSHEYWLEFYDPSLALKSNNQIVFNVGVMGNSYDIEDIICSNGIIYAFVSHWDNTKLMNSLSMKTVTLEGELVDYMDLSNTPAEKYGKRGDIDVVISANGQKILVYNAGPFEKKMNEIVNFACYDIKSKKLDWEHSETLALPSERGYNNHFAVSNGGKALMFKKYSEKMKWKYAMYTCGASEWDEHALTVLGERAISDFKLTTNNQNEFIFYALIADDASKYNSKVESLMTVKISTDLENVDIKETTLPADLVGKVEGGNGNFIRNVTLKDVLYRKDGKALVLMEKITSRKDGVPGTEPVQYRYEWSYGDFIAICLNDEDQSLAWTQSFKKEQKTINNEEEDNYGSVVYHLKNDRLYVLWNNTALSVPSIPPAGWKEPDGTKYVKKEAFNEKTMYATFMHVIEADGKMVYGNRTHGLPLLNMHRGIVFEMSLTTRFFFDYKGDIVVMSTMHNDGMRYQFGLIGF